ncbi:hypothetical protein [Leptolyngbya sp. AN10]|uniref:hypothetical protein n=1 Tax=Leptolyngbya sp. AN10 TaxID=3423365 RepID=UPI003D314C12
MNQKSAPPRMTAIFRSEEERCAAHATLNSYNLTFSQYVRHSLCYRRLPPYSIDLPIYQVAVRFLWAQYRILNNLRYLKAQARLGRIPLIDEPKVNAAIEENHQISLAILEAIKVLKPTNDEDTTWLLEHATTFNQKSTIERDNPSQS